MSEAEKNQANSSRDEAGLFRSSQSEREPRNWTGAIVGFAVVLLVVVLLVLVGHRRPQTAPAADAYSPNLVVTAAAVSQADNFVGSTVTYIDLTVKNNGTRTVVGGLVFAAFHNLQGEVVQTESLPLRVLAPHALGGAAEAVELSHAPLGPGQTRVVRLTLEHVSSDWNQAQPAVEFRRLRLR